MSGKMAVLKVVSGMHKINKSTFRTVVLTKQIKSTKKKKAREEKDKGWGERNERISCSGLGLHSICLLEPIRVTLDRVT